MSRSAYDLQVLATAHSASCGHPGYVPDDYLEHLDGLGVETTITAAELCAIGTWERAGGGYRILDWEAVEYAQLRGFPDPARAELIRYFTLAPADEAFVRKFRGQDNVLGATVQLCTLPWLGLSRTTWPPPRPPWWPGCRSGWASRSARCAGTVPVSRPAPITCARSPDTWGGGRRRPALEGAGGVPVRAGNGARLAQAAVPAGL